MEGEAAHHVGRVLRLSQGKCYELSDGARVRLGRVENVTRDEVEFAFAGRSPSYQPAVQTNVVLAIVKFDAFEWALEKSRQAWCRRDCADRSGAERKGAESGAAKPGRRWQKILAGASEQSRRVRVPELSEATRTADAFGRRTLD